MKRLYFDRIFHRSYWTWRKHPVIIIPSMLGTAISVIEQSIITLAGILLLTSLAARGLLPGFLSELNNNLLGLFQDPRYLPDIILLTTVLVVTLPLVAVLGSGFVLASEYGTYLQAWKDDVSSTRSLLANGSRRWRAMAWTYFVSNLITWGPAIAGYAVLLVALLNSGTFEGALTVLVSFYVLGLGVFGSLVISIFTLFSYPTVMVDSVSGLRAVRHSFRVASQHLGITITYAVVRGLFQLLLILVVLTGSIIFLPLSSVSAAVLSLLLTPILHSTKTMIYSSASPSEHEMPYQISSPIWYDIGRSLPRAVWGKIRMGLSEVGQFLLGPRNVPFHLASTVAFVVGMLLGEYVSNNGVASFLQSQGYIPGQGNPVLNHLFQRPVLGFDIFLNNWLVSIATALAGIGFGAPSFLTILFNGFIVGIILPLTPSLTMFLAAIIPHGIIEIPSFILSGSVGMKLGYAAWRARFQPGEESSAYLSLTLRQTVYIVVGLAPLFLIAGLIEGDLTPIIMQWAGWKFPAG